MLSEAEAENHVAAITLILGRNEGLKRCAAAVLGSTTMRTIRLSSSFPPLPPQPPRPPSPPPPEGSPLDTDVIIVLGAVLCVLICAVWVHSIVRCMLRRNRRAALMAAAAAAAVQAAEQMDASFVGLDPKTIAALPVVLAPNPNSESAEPGIPSTPPLIISNTECIICLQEFAQGEAIKLLPNCGHGFHVECIGAWLRSHSSCPICRHAVLEPPSPLGGASSSRGSVDVSSSSMLLASPLMQHYQQQLYYQQNQQQFRQIGSGSSSLYTMFAADGGRAASILRVLHLSETPAAATTATAAAAGPRSPGF